MCSVKTIVKVALGIGALLILGYLLFPESRALIAAAAPYLLILACPLGMYFMMKDKNTPEEREPERDGK
ncbi:MULTISPECIES: DUF2933 domain-containing protein [Massilia]|uniref:DUF2933 domain-containing protein n=1 Tax=Massilia TaxID=149698 RepID=UPI00068B942E|nr:MULTISPECIES: DUF2933 domain-containing protein [Massilia]ALK99682.2 hypothetical protein AM586_17560 [Massilia sp. WG5]